MRRSEVTTRGVELAGSNRLVAELRSEHAETRERAWRVLYDEHYRRAYRLVCRYGVATADVEDLVQRAFVIAYQRIREVDEIRDAGAWLRGIVVRVVAQHRRWRRVREAKRWLLTETRLAETAPVVTPERNAAAAQELERARRIVDRMSAKLRDVLVLSDIEECRPQEVAEILEIPVNTVRSRRRLAREQFARLWASEYGGPHD